MFETITTFLKKQDEIETSYFDFFLLSFYDLSLLVFYEKISARNFLLLVFVSILILFGLVHLHNKLIKLLKSI